MKYYTTPFAINPITNPYSKHRNLSFHKLICEEYGKNECFIFNSLSNIEQNTFWTKSKLLHQHYSSMNKHDVISIV